MENVAFWLEMQNWVKHAKAGHGPGLSRIGMAKSALLGRLMRGEEVRRRACPRHKGQMWCSWGLDEAARPCACEGTGWLPNDETRDDPSA